MTLRSLRCWGVSAITVTLVAWACVAAAEASKPLPGKVGFHEAIYDAEGRLAPWTTWIDAIDREMNWYLNCPLDSHGYPTFVFTTFMDDQYKPYKTDIIPCTQDGMGILSYLKYWEYKGKSNQKVLEWAKKMGDYLVNETLTPNEGRYPRFTRSTGNHSDFPIKRSSQNDLQYGENVIEPDKGGISGFALLKLYDVTKDRRYLDQAVQNVEVLVKNMREGDAQHSPWPFRVDAITGQYWGERNGNMVFNLRLFDELIARGNTKYQQPRDALWKWIKQFQLTAPEGRDASLWIQFFEDQPLENNRTSWAPLEMARYLIERKEALDPDWKKEAEKCIEFAIKHFGYNQPGGVITVVEQDTDMRPWGGACSKLGGVAAMFYAAGGGGKYKEMAFRNLTWMTYHIDSDGCPAHQTADLRQRRGGWQEDCHTDVIHNFMDAIAAVPEWATAGPPDWRANVPALALETPKTIAFCASPNGYFNDHAGDVAKIYDGLFFNIGSWDGGVESNLGVKGGPPATTDWKDKVRENIANLREVGATENLLGVSFGETEPWPSPDTLLSPGFTEKFAQRFGMLGAQAKALGFRGVSIDIEYPYKRYSVNHEIYTYKGYAVEDLVKAASDQGRAAMSALLDEFPDAVVFVLPGTLGGRVIGQAFTLGMLQVMVQRNAPGGFHLGYEKAYSLHEGPVSQLAITRSGDGSAELLLDDRAMDYWRRRCTVAPGVWPLHMVETVGKDYPVRPWSEELAELKQQMQVLRMASKRYIWSYSGKPIWYRHTPELESKYGLASQGFDHGDEVIKGWHDILADKTPEPFPQLDPLLRSIAAYDGNKLPFTELCARFGTPAEWLILGPLGNPFTRPGYAQSKAFLGPIRMDKPVHGKDGLVRWFVYRNYEPQGNVSLAAAFDWRNTDDCSVHAVTALRSEQEITGFLHLGWDDGAIVWLGDKMVMDHRTYPERGHGMLYRDRYIFEDKTAITIPKGESRLAVTSINSHGSWGFNIRITDEKGLPLDGLSFAIPSDAK